MQISELRKYYYLSLEIKNIKEKLQMIAEQSVGVSELTGMPHGTGISDPVGRKVELLDKYSRKLEVKEIEAIEEMIKIETFIETIPDIEARIIFNKRYIELKSWVVISREMNMSERSVYRKHREYIKVNNA